MYTCTFVSTFRYTSSFAIDIDETKKKERISSDTYYNKRKHTTTTNIVLPKMTAIRDRKHVKSEWLYV